VRPAGPASLTLLRCAACGRIEGAARALCPACLSQDLQPVTVPGAGRIASFTTIRRAPTRFRGSAPYDVVVVDLDAGPRVTGRLTSDSPPPAIGAAVHALGGATEELLFTVSEPA
jgi:uncharacterized OB-fold protein